MKPRRRNASKAGTKGTQLLPDGMIPVRPFPLHANPENAPHYLGKVLTPEQMAAKVPPGAAWWAIDAATEKALAALVGCGPEQAPPHCATYCALAEGIARLRDFALAGDKDAMLHFGNLVSIAVADLGEMARRHPEIVRTWSSKRNVVPVLTGRNIGHRKYLDADLKAFAVGEATPYRVNPSAGKKAPDSSTRANVLAGQLCEHLASHRALARAHAALLAKPLRPEWVRLASTLPELSLPVWKRWADAAWECILDATNGHPEENDGLKSLGQKAARRDGLQSPRTLAANIRAEIRQTLNEAIRGIARRAPLSPSE
jgi:hypothetical protein